MIRSSGFHASVTNTTRRHRLLAALTALLLLAAGCAESGQSEQPPAAGGTAPATPHSTSRTAQSRPVTTASAVSAAPKPGPTRVQTAIPTAKPSTSPRSPQPPTSNRTSGVTRPAAPLAKCVRIPSAQAAKIMGVPGAYARSDYAQFPCDAFWTSPVQWEQGQGDDSLHGRPSDAQVSVVYIDFATAQEASAEFAAIRKLRTGGKVNGIPVEVLPVPSNGDADAFLYQPTATFFAGSYTGSQAPSELIGRCGRRLLDVSASLDAFYSAVADGHSPNEENIVQRSRLPQKVDKQLRAAYTDIGEGICAQDNPPSTVIGPWQRVAG